MGLVWVITEYRDGETTIIRIVATKKIAEEYVKHNYASRPMDAEWNVVTDEPDIKTSLYVDEDLWRFYVDKNEWIYEHSECPRVTMKQWIVEA